MSFTKTLVLLLALGVSSGARYSPNTTPENNFTSLTLAFLAPQPTGSSEEATTSPVEKHLFPAVLKALGDLTLGLEAKITDTLQVTPDDVNSPGVEQHVNMAVASFTYGKKLQVEVMQKTISSVKSITQGNAWVTLCLKLKFLKPLSGLHYPATFKICFIDTAEGAGVYEFRPDMDYADFLPILMELNSAGIVVDNVNIQPNSLTVTIRDLNSSLKGNGYIYWGP